MKLRGIHWNKARNRWDIIISQEGKSKWIAHAKTQREAAIAMNEYQKTQPNPRFVYVPKD